MKKFILKKNLPLAKAWEIVVIKKNFWNSSIYRVYEFLENDKYNTWKLLASIEEKDLNIWLEEIKEKPKSIFDLKKWGTYYYVNHYWQIQECRYIHYENLDIIINNWKSYISYEEAEKELKKRQAIQRIKKYCWENNIELADREFILNDLNVKTYICYDISDDIFCIDYFTDSFSNQDFIFKNMVVAQKVIDNCEKDLRIIFNI